jgi:predicted flavoprotein YhiN
MSSNSGFELDQLGELGSLQGSALKNCRVFSDTLEKHGDAVLTSYGIEGAPVYALNGEYRKGKKIFIDLKPDLSEPEIKDRLSKGVTVTESLKALKLSKGAIALLKNYLSKEEFTNPSILAARIKKLELKIAGVRPLEEVISSVGGIVHSEVTADFELVRFPGIYCVGEMIDWDAPTGGYLIQGCVSSGMKAARSILIGQS